MTTTHDLEERLEAMFSAQAHALDVPARAWSALTTSPTPVPARPARRIRTLAAVALATFSAVLGLAAVSRLSPQEQRVETSGTASESPDPAAAAPGFKVETRQVSLTAQSLSILADGKTFSTAAPLDVSGDPGTQNEYTTLELNWREHGVEMRLYIYFKSDGREWWSEEIRTYDGRQPAEWITYTGDFFRRPLGTAYVGDLDVSARDHGVKGRLRLPGLRLEAFRRPTG